MKQYPAKDDDWLSESGIRLVRFQLPAQYSQLAYYLAAGQWQDANAETAKVMLQVAGQEQRGWLKEDDIKKFPLAGLRQIDQLWQNYSLGHFGFSVQKHLYEHVGGQPGGYNYDTYKQFSDRVGWYVKEKDEWLNKRDLTFTLNAPLGHLPFGGWLDTGFSNRDTIHDQTPLFGGWAFLVTLFWRI